MLAALPVPVIRILFFCLVPLGVYLLIVAIGLVRKGFNGKLLVEMPVLTRKVAFAIPKPGSYAIWQKAPLFQRVPVDTFKPVITHQLTCKVVVLSTSRLRGSTNDGSTGRMELFTFTAFAGDYILELTEGSSSSALESIVAKAVAARPVDSAQYFVQVRENPPFYYTIVGIPLIILSGLCIVGGVVLGILAHRI